MPESTPLLGAATMPLSDPPGLGVRVDPVADVPAVPAVPAVPVWPVWANAKPEAAKLKTILLATKRRDISFS
jgi:hypothetical protein